MNASCTSSLLACVVLALLCGSCCGETRYDEERMSDIMVTVDGQLCYTYPHSVSNRIEEFTCAGGVVTGTIVRLTRVTPSVLSSGHDYTINLCEFEVNSCADGYYGLGCQYQCGDGCDDVCNKVHGACSCTVGWRPPLCQQGCDAGYYGQDCQYQCGAGCEGVCSKADGTCSCVSGWKPPFCQECEDGKYGPNCTETCGDHCDDVCDKQTGHCTCQVEYRPPFCSLTSPDPKWDDSSPPDGSVVHVCLGDHVRLAWRYNLSAGHVLDDVEWFYDGSFQGLVALISQGQFIALPAFSGRVQLEGNSGILLSGVSVNDTGNYSVVVKVQDSAGVLHVLRRSVFLQIRDRLLTQDGSLHVTVSEVVRDPSTGQWALQLQCGAFLVQGPPPFHVDWVIPSGTSVASSDYHDGNFSLTLKNPVQGGNYTCRIPAHHASTVCAHSNVTGQREATIFVDEVLVRLSLMERENADLRHRVERIENGSPQQRVGFHVFRRAATSPDTATHYISTTVTYNHLNGYNSTSDRFTAPLPGLYFFLFSTEAGTADTVFSHYMYLDTHLPHNVSQATALLGKAFSSPLRGHPAMISIHCTVSMMAGQSVYVVSHQAEESLGDSFYTASFSGFLIVPGP